MRGRRSIGAVTLAGVVLAGCAGSASPTAVATPVPTRYPIATAPDQAILRIEVDGLFARRDGLPALVLSGDGLVLEDPAETACCGLGPLVPTMSAAHLSASEIQTILRLSARAGLMGANAHYEANITDADQTTYTVIVGGVEHKVSSYGGGSAPGPNKDERVVLDGFFDQVLEHLDGLLGRLVGWDSYAPASIEVTAQEPWNWHGPQSGGPAWLWPLATDPGSVANPSNQPRYGCLIITGSDMAVFTAAAMDAPADSVWSAQSGPWQLKARPVIPGAVPCTGGW